MSVLVTGANRGIGLEFVRQLVQSLQPPKYVFATYRSKDTAQGLDTIKESSRNCQVIPIQMDITKKAEIESLRTTIEGYVGDLGLNLLINNAGALRMGSLNTLTEEDMMFHFATNTIGPVMIFKEMLPLLQKSVASQKSVLNLSKPTALNISSMTASIKNLDQEPIALLDPLIPYRTSKSALNMAMRCIALSLKDKNVLMVNMCPGRVKTDMGSSGADIEASESVSAMLDTLPKIEWSRHGDFMDRKGNAIAF